MYVNRVQLQEKWNNMFLVRTWLAIFLLDNMFGILSTVFTAYHQSPMHFLPLGTELIDILTNTIIYTIITKKILNTHIKI